MDHNFLYFIKLINNYSMENTKTTKKEIPRRSRQQNENENKYVIALFIQFTCSMREKPCSTQTRSMFSLPQ